MKNYLISEAIGDIAGSAYEGRAHRIKDYNKVKMFSTRAHFIGYTEEYKVAIATVLTISPINRYESILYSRFTKETL
jgi:hypothetical protein